MGNSEQKGLNMKKFAKSVLGVTLLEIMLVLAIAAMIIVMSVRYYQSATANQQANAALEMIQGITASADSLAQAKGTYSSVNASNIQALMPNTSMLLPWGTAITISSGTTTYAVSLTSTPAAVCTLLSSRLGSSKKYTSVTSTCTSAGTFSYTYDTTK
jgi:type II secretory pathway pseudopilin PulG